MKKQITKHTIHHYLQPIIIAIAALAVTGCKSIDPGPFQNFAASADKVNTSAQAAYDLLAKTGADRAKQTLVESSLPPYMSTNKAVLLGNTFIPDESIQERLKLTSALLTYAQALANLAAGPAQKQFDTSTAGLAQALKSFQGENVTNLFGANLSQILPTQSQIEAFSGAVQMIGNLILDAETKKDVKKILQQGTPAILCVTTNLENDIGIDIHDNMRDYFHRYYIQSLRSEFGVTEWTNDDGTVTSWDKLSKTDRQRMVQDAISLATEMQTTDKMLADLRDSYGKFRKAHEALKSVVDQSQQFSVSSALSAFNEAAQKLDNVVNSLKKTK